MFLLNATESGIDIGFTLSVKTNMLSDLFFSTVSFTMVLVVSINTTCALLTKEKKDIKQKRESCFIGIKVKTEKIDWLKLNNIYKILVFSEIMTNGPSLSKTFTFVVLLEKTC
jgi:hypothetical protein